MRVLPLDLVDLPSLPPLALTIGNYDGVHLGHQSMLKSLVADAKRLALSSAVMVFEPQPREFFSPDNPPARLSNLNEKTDLIASLGVDFLLVADFNDDFRKLSAADFVKLLTKLQVKHLVLGDDFRFGHDRLGDKDFLKAANFSVDSLASVLIQGQRVSSSLIRQSLAAGDLASAKTYLGRNYIVKGKVVHGDKIGRSLDFPTANVALERRLPALHGVFGADILAYRDGQQLDWLELADSHKKGVVGLSPNSLWAAVSVGKRPSVNGQDWRLEVHLPNFSGDLYGLDLQVVFLHYLHGEKKYSGLDELKAAIAQDVLDLLTWRQAFF